MKWWKRAWKSLWYRWKKNLLLCLVIMTAVLLLLPAGRMRSAADEALLGAQEELGAYVYMMREEGNVDGTEKENYYSPQLAEEIAALPQVKSASHMTAVNVYSDRVRGMDVCDEAQWSGADSWREPKTDPYSGDNTEGWMQVIGVTEIGNYWDFRNGNGEVTEGTGITCADAGKEIMVLAQKTASDNQIRIGEKASFRSYYDPEISVDLTLVGLHNGKIWHGYGNAGHSSNYIYVPLDTALKLYSGIMESRYELKNPQELEAFVEQAEEIAQRSDEKVKFIGDSIRYLTTSAALENVRKTGDAVAASVLLMAVVLVVLLAGYSWMEQKREREILLAMGESKSRIVGQAFLEFLLPAAAALAAGILVGMVLTEPLGGLMLGRMLGAGKM